MPLHLTTICPGCHQPFVPNNRGRRKHCSTACSNRARAQSLADRFWAKVDKSGGLLACWPWIPKPGFHGYGIIKWRGKNRRANRVAWILTYGEIPDGLWVLHNCPGGDNRRCCNPAHLYLGDRADNTRDAIEKDQYVRGDRHYRRISPGKYPASHKPRPSVQGANNPHARLTNEVVQELRARYARGDRRPTAFAREFGVSRSTIHNAVTGAGWKHLNLPAEQLQ